MPFNKKIAFLGKLDSIKIENVYFLSFENINTALMDYDILIFHPNLFYKKSNNKSYSYEEYNNINLEWSNKIYEFLCNKNIFIFATKPTQLSSKTIYSPVRTSYIYTSDIFETILKFINKKEEYGKVILKKTNGILDNFYNRFKELLQYNITYEKVMLNNTLFNRSLSTNSQINSQSIDIFTGRDKNKISSSIIKIDNGGNILLLPEVVFEETKDLTDLLNIIVEIDKKLKNIKNPKPQWLENNENYSISISESIKSKLANIDKEINKLNENKEKLNQNLEKEEQIKDLLFENGKPLENAIIEALRILGYEAENKYR